MLVDVIGEIVIDRLIEAVVFNVPATMPHFNDRLCARTLHFECGNPKPRRNWQIVKSRSSKEANQILSP